MWIEAKGAGVEKEGGPDQIQAGRASDCLSTMIKLSCRAREIGGGAAQAGRVTGGQGRMCVPNQAPARASGQFGERRPDPSHRRRASEDVESLTEVITAFIAVGGRQSGELPDAVRVAEQSLVIEAPGPAAGQEASHLRLRRRQAPAPPKRIGRREDSPHKDEQQDDGGYRHEAGEQIGFGVVALRVRRGEDHGEEDEHQEPDRGQSRVGDREQQGGGEDAWRHADR